MDYTSLITSQHADKPKFVAMVGAMANGIGAITDVVATLPANFDIDNALGKQLDTVGLWVGQSRVINGVLTVGYFGFSDNVAAFIFGEEGNPSIGGRFYEEGEAFTGTSVLADPEYRAVLKAKIIRNHYDGSVEEIERALQYIFGVPAHIVDEGQLSFDVVIEGPLYLIGQSLLTNFDLLPRPMNVSIGNIIYTNLSGHARDVASASAQL